MENAQIEKKIPSETSIPFQSVHGRSSIEGWGGPSGGECQSVIDFCRVCESFVSATKFWRFPISQLELHSKCTEENGGLEIAFYRFFFDFINIRRINLFNFFLS